VISYCFSIPVQFGTFIRTVADTDVKLVSVERLRHYATIQQELVDVGRGAPSYWPKKGEVHFRNVTMKFRDNVHTALMNVSFLVKGGSKIAIIGRTGSGKSAILNALMRFSETTGGQILLDQIDISTLSVKTVRSIFNIVPQVPTLFIGSIRFNLDPCSLYTDKEIWDVLEMVQLKDVISVFEKKIRREWKKFFNWTKTVALICKSSFEKK